MKESLSALLDGECSASELERVLSELERDPALREQLSRQWLARESRMGTRIRSADLGFSTRVLAALHDEPAVVVPFAGRVRRLPWRAAASLAAAAALGAIAVLVVRPQAPFAPGAVSAVAAAPADTAPAVTEPVERQFAELEDENARQLRNYVMAYSQSRGQHNVGATLGYARYAAYTDAGPAAQRTTELKQP